MIQLNENQVNKIVHALAQISNRSQSNAYQIQVAKEALYEMQKENKCSIPREMIDDLICYEDSPTIKELVEKYGYVVDDTYNN